MNIFFCLIFLTARDIFRNETAKEFRIRKSQVPKVCQDVH